MEYRCKETLEVKQTSAGHAADPSTTKHDLYAAHPNPENVVKTCSAVKPQKFPETLALCCKFAAFERLLRVSFSTKLCFVYESLTLRCLELEEFFFSLKHSSMVNE